MRKVYNMGSCETDCTEEFIELVKQEEQLQDWTFTLGVAPSLCIVPDKKIIIKEKIIGRYPWEVKEEVLHEVAHVNTYEEAKSIGEMGHGPMFYKEYIRLLQKYMVGDE
ncbi:MAG: hypothetical protein KAS32_30030 [Candidatus Peribacteraceae bacterium]|nr:hypothetical protein [Candidatus Peribacteraceae bacterium]